MKCMLWLSWEVDLLGRLYLRGIVVIGAYQSLS